MVVVLCRVSYVAAYTMICLAQHSLLLSTLVCGWAVVTALSRALMGRHYLGDVVTGLLLGVVTTAVVTQVMSLLALSSISSKCVDLSHGVFTLHLEKQESPGCSLLF